VLVPWSSGVCCIPFFSVPTGPWVLWQSCGKNQGVLAPGLKCCWAPWKRISHIVTKAAVTYDAPTYNVPTADNVMVNVDISLSFKISGGPDAASDFVYKIGAPNFNAYLSSKVEEAVRGLVYGVPHNKVNDLRETFATSMLNNLSSTFSRFGVQMMNVKVTDVRLPPELQSRLEKTTAFQTKIEEAQKLQETKVLLLENDSKKKLEALKKDNSLQLQNVTAECTRYMTEWQEMREAQMGLSKVQETKARGQAESRLAGAKGNRDVAKAQGQREAEELVRGAAIQSAASKVKADEEANTVVVKSEARLLAAKNAAEGMVAKAQAEAGAVQKLAVKRKFELEFRRLEVMKEIAGSGRKIFSGAAADQLMNQLVESSVPVHV
jgi:regulator of protease activity HflC (stomatin/prohibitin superfamily)